MNASYIFFKSEILREQKAQKLRHHICQQNKIHKSKVNGSPDKHTSHVETPTIRNL